MMQRRTRLDRAARSPAERGHARRPCRAATARCDHSRSAHLTAQTQNHLRDWLRRRLPALQRPASHVLLIGVQKVCYDVFDFEEANLARRLHSILLWYYSTSECKGLLASIAAHRTSADASQRLLQSVRLHSTAASPTAALCRSQFVTRARVHT